MITLRKQRWSGAPAISIGLEHAGDDEWGTWVLVPPLMPHLDETGWVVYMQATGVLGLIPPDSLWTAWFGLENGKIDISTENEVDLGTDLVRFVDAELDVVWRWGTPARIVDWDEFEELDMPGELASSLVAEAEMVRERIDRGDPPFGRATRDRLVDLVGHEPEEVLRRAWMGGMSRHVYPYAVASFDEAMLDPWWGRQRAKDGWMLAGGIDDNVTAIVWVPRDEQPPSLIATSLRESSALPPVLLRAAASVSQRPPPPTD